MSLFITFEGLDYSGKSTQVRRLEATLRTSGDDVLVLREPGGTTVGESIRTILLDRATVRLTPAAELFLFSASRAQLVEEVIRPALRRGVVVICDRFYDSTTAYQGGGRGIDADVIRAVNAAATGGLVPDLTLFLDVPGDERIRRCEAVGAAHDRIESNGEDFYRRVRDAFIRLAATESRFQVIDGTKPEQEVARQIGNLIHHIRQRHGSRS